MTLLEQIQEEVKRLPLEKQSEALNFIVFLQQRGEAKLSPLPASNQPKDHPYIESVPTILSGEPVIKGTRTPVRAIVEHWKLGDSPDEIARNLPHLRLAQIFDALGYYDDHREEIDKYIELNRVPVND
jgi:uncharacterized protein (DUF433 family)